MLEQAPTLVEEARAELCERRLRGKRGNERALALLRKCDYQRGEGPYGNYIIGRTGSVARSFA